MEDAVAGPGNHPQAAYSSSQEHGPVADLFMDAKDQSIDSNSVCFAHQKHLLGDTLISPRPIQFVANGRKYDYRAGKIKTDS
jgi:hypothetical protein